MTTKTMTTALFFLLAITLAACGDNLETDAPDANAPTDCAALLHEQTEQALDVWEVMIELDVVGPGDTYRCGAPDVDGAYPITWSQSPRRRLSDGALGFVGRPRLEQWPSATCAFFPADAVRYAGDSRAASCDGGDAP